MKTRYKIFLVIACFIAFYVGIIPVLGYCLESGADCTLYQELILLTRPTITVYTPWEGISEWSGTAEEIEKPTIAMQIMRNIPFVTSMIVLPFVIIGLIVVLDKRK
ncbi:Hypothetical protein Nlim_0796 [Candidatus Nitrosarchaeum limnium SFB1]|jgi:hypothetical protein|uniref:Uncharacterized protein n=1 Tax=Candidatus Nitrosarchaeum limnium SFB1 TaxID=886738 RepID=F3KJY7_9ARCH|nr:Hypothetical protein Nlim_0796 [Candidatus Nitrosarchaeum limnium SFB1]